jgi:hypothetical protein
MTMFPMPMPEMPQGIIDMVGANPEGFAEAMGSGMEAMTAAMEGGASPADAFEAMGDTMGPMMEEMGMSPDMFDAMGDMVGAAVGPAMHMAPADASPADMGAMMQDGIDMMMPPGVEVPGPIMDAMGDMGSAMGDAGMGCHDVGAEMMGDPGSDTYMLPVDADGNAVVEPGQPETCPADACQAPPADGACASTDMMPPVVGYDHAPMQDEFVMPEPFDMATATNVSEGLNPDGSSPLDNVESVPVLGDPDFVEAAPVDLGGALGVAPALGEEGFVGADPAADAADAALGNAMDGATAQGGGEAPVIGDPGFVEAAPVPVDDTPVDDGSSAGG